MTLTPYRALPLILGVALLPGIASAQAVGSNYVSVSSAPSGAIYAPGTASASLGTITLSAAQPGTVSVASLPLTITGTNGASANNLSSCSLVNSSGSILNTGANAFGTMSAGTNTVTFDAPFMVTSGSPQVLTLRCNLASTAPSGTSYSYSVGTPVLAPQLAASMTVFPNISAGEVNAPLAAITLYPGASGADLNLSSLPISASYSGGLTQGDLSNCRITNASSMVLDQNGTGLLDAGANTFTLDTTMPLSGGGAAVPLILSCTVSSAAPAGGSVALSLSPSGILASNAVNGAAITPTQGYDPATGALLSLAGAATVGGVGVVTPPNTGAGAGAPVAIIAMVLAALAALGSWGVLVKAKSTR